MPLLALHRFSAKKNLFKFRVSPIVSGCVYISYLVFLISLLDREVRMEVVVVVGPSLQPGWPGGLTEAM